MFSQLITSRRFWPMFWCQFVSALNDNFIKNALAILILYQIATTSGGALVALAGAVLVIPFFFLSALGGELADKYDKARIAQYLKLAEIPVAVLAAIGFLMAGSGQPALVDASIYVLFAVLFLFGCGAALFGPIKFGMLPDHLETKELPAANAMVEGATFLAILAGTIAGGIAMTTSEGAALVPAWAVGVAIIGFAAIGWWSAKMMMPTGRGQPDLIITTNPLTSTFRQLGELKATRRLWIGGLIVSWFWLNGIVVTTLLPALIKENLGGTESVVTLSLAVFTIGIAVGSFLAARASRRRPNLALVPIGALLMGVVALDIAGLLWRMDGVVENSVDAVSIFASWTGIRLMSDLALLAAAGGLFIVPAFAAVQSWAEADHRARTIAAVNILNAAFMSVASLGVFAAQLNGVSLAVLFGVLGVANLVAMLLVMRAWGREGLQDLGMFIFKQFLGLKVKGLENLPPAGTKAVIAPNHVSLLDAPILFSAMPSHSAFAILHVIDERPHSQWPCRINRCPLDELEKRFDPPLLA
ncbi:MAG: MFS transporter, partial [Pseudomonadota bacterium]